MVAYQIVVDGIIIEWKNGGKYLYNSIAPGKDKVDEMIKLAKAGKGLSTYISKVVKKNFYSKL